jgi:hypothetical protein
MIAFPGHRRMILPLGPTLTLEWIAARASPAPSIGLGLSIDGSSVPLESTLFPFVPIL